MKPSKIAMISFGVFLLGFPLQARPLVKFKAGTPAVADSINANFEILNSRIDSVGRNSGAEGATDIATIRKSLDTAYVGYGENRKVASSIKVDEIIMMRSGDTANLHYKPHSTIGPKGMSFYENAVTAYAFGLDDVSGLRIQVRNENHLAVRSGYIELLKSVHVFDDLRVAKANPNTVSPGVTFANQSSVISVDSLASYINVNKALPGFPTQAEVDAKGISLIELNRVLVQKIEEMSTYIINQEQRIKALEAKP